jgi:hypothetical protein
MSCEAYCSQSFHQHEVAPSKRQVNIAFINKDFANCDILVLLELCITIIICHSFSKSRYGHLFFSFNLLFF